MRRSGRNEAAVSSSLHQPRCIQPVCAPKLLCVMLSKHDFQGRNGLNCSHDDAATSEELLATRLAMHHLPYPACLKTPKRACILSFVLRSLQCNLRCLISAIDRAARLFTLLLLLHSTRSQCPACRSRPTANGLQKSSPAPRASSRRPCRCKSSQEAIYAVDELCTAGPTRSSVPFCSS